MFKSIFSIIKLSLKDNHSSSNSACQYIILSKTNISDLENITDCFFFII